MKAATPQKKPKPGGRPRGFDEGEVLDRAMRVFWQKGFEGASLADLTEAMGIKPPSLYAAFGNKESLFRKALEYFGKGPAAFVNECLGEPTARKVAERRLYGSVEMMCNPRHPWGCMGTQAAVTCGEAGSRIREELIEVRARNQESLRKRFERAKKEGDLPKTADPAALAAYITMVATGLSVQAASGVSCEELKAAVDTAMRAWPGNGH